jgi:DNA-binding PadR family transcriptional regulator
MSVPLTLLGLLERGPSHGYDLTAARKWFGTLGPTGSLDSVSGNW